MPQGDKFPSEAEIVIRLGRGVSLVTPPLLILLVIYSALLLERSFGKNSLNFVSAQSTIE